MNAGPAAPRLTAASLAALLSACSTNGTLPDVPAIRTSLTDASTTELELVLSSALDGVEVSVADDALAESSTLIIERGLRRRVDAPPEAGRDYGRPQHFELVVNARRCFLVHQETGLRWMLNDTTCVAADPR